MVMGPTARARIARTALQYFFMPRYLCSTPLATANLGAMGPRTSGSRQLLRYNKHHTPAPSTYSSEYAPYLANKERFSHIGKDDPKYPQSSGLDIAGYQS